MDRVIDKASEEAKAREEAKAKEAKKSMLDRVVDEIGSKKKISSLTKSSYDWDKFKQEKGKLRRGPTGVDTIQSGLLPTALALCHLLWHISTN